MLSPFRHFDRDTRRAIFLAGTVGLHMVSGVAVGVCIGYLLDRWLETSPRLTMIFLGVGIVAGFRNMRADARRLMAMLDNNGAKEEAVRPGAADSPAETAARGQSPPARKE